MVRCNNRYFRDKFENIEKFATTISKIEVNLKISKNLHLKFKNEKFFFTQKILNFAFNFLFHRAF